MKPHGIPTKPKDQRATYPSRHLVKEASLLKMYQTHISPPLIHTHLQSIAQNTCSFLKKFQDLDVEGYALDSLQAIQ